MPVYAGASFILAWIRVICREMPHCYCCTSGVLVESSRWSCLPASGRPPQGSSRFPGVNKCKKAENEAKSIFLCSFTSHTLVFDFCVLLSTNACKRKQTNMLGIKVSILTIFYQGFVLQHAYNVWFTQLFLRLCHFGSSLCVRQVFHLSLSASRLAGCCQPWLAFDLS